LIDILEINKQSGSVVHLPVLTYEVITN
jgi:hypothetical protein